MPKKKYTLHDGQRGSALAVRVTPRARRNEIVEIRDDGTVRIRIAAVPADGEANQTLIRFLADILEVDPKGIDIVAGLNGRDKLISILGIEAADLQRKILEHIQ